ncbi:hypothetical protein [Variovorax guangxiensis]|uniref:Uncharacterized protein n=1 Tax=Variovorax guangxiensis TaxID=1775474 RepID=A0A502DD10_9BURK|nr:hypothetical protein [Variovorax guangxiensis]TPG23465.1 hypothetical protein EAH82_20590 [Variovorax guangxiensis]TPG24076.1 hypothetical protein EAH83_06130 [Variovorax ginsengisoli]
MARAAETEAAQRVHVFLGALRFDTRLQFQTRDAIGRRAWRELPTPETSPDGSGWVALLQAAALVRGKSPTLRAIARATLAGLPMLTPGDFMVRIPALEKGVQARWHPGSQGLKLPPDFYGPALACLSGARGISWALVVGWEQAAQGTTKNPEGLLLLDPRLAAPWGTAYNARLLLGQGRWRGLDGEVQRCELLGLVDLSAR